MRGIPLNPQGEEGSFYSSKKRNRFEGFSAEPISVLDSPPTSSSTLSSSPLVAGGGGGGSSSSAAGVEDWETMLSDSPALSPIKDQTFLQWVMTDTDPSQAPMGFDFPGFGLVDPQFQFDPIIPPPPPPSSSAAGKVAIFGEPSNSLFYQHHPIEEDNPLAFPPGFAFNQNPANSLPYNLQHRPNMPMLFTGDESAMAAAQQQALIDNLFMAAELIEAGNSVTARGILSRLNHQLLSPIGKKPLLRSAFYFNAALLRLLADPAMGPSSPPTTLLEVVLKLGAYKAFSEASPALQFTNFTSIQTILEVLDGSDHIHVLDFDIGIGGQWSSFMQELAQRRSSAGTAPSLKITAFTSHRSHHPFELELHLTHENLSHFARNLNIPFEFNALSLDSSDPSSLLSLFAGVDEAVAVNLPVGSTHGIPLPAALSLVKQISPKIVVSVDNGLDRSELPFSRRFIHSLQSSTVLLDSIDSTGTNPDVANKIERFILQPRIESSLTGRHRDPNSMIPWRTIFTSAGLIPMQFSNFTETQAECLLKRVQVRGFHVEKRQASLFLCWQRGELVSVSAWRC